MRRERGLSRNGFVHQAGQKHGPDQIHQGGGGWRAEKCGEEEEREGTQPGKEVVPVFVINTRRLQSV